MRAQRKYDRVTVALAAVVFVTCGTGCATRTLTHTESQEVVTQTAQQAPGVVEYVWEEPMVDVVEVPPGLDPEGHYYRPAHQEVVEIRQGRWNYYKGK